MWAGEAPDLKQTPWARRIKTLLLRAFVIYQRREQFSPEVFERHRCDLKRRWQQCVFLMLNERHSRWGKRQYTLIPYYWFALIASEAPLDLTSQLRPKVKREVRGLPQRSRYAQAWISAVRLGLAVCTQNSKIVRLKARLGNISLLPIQVGGQPVRARGVWLSYHDLYHLEVAQLERIRIGQDWVSGIHGINRRVFHASPIVEEYDSFRDEARVALHEALTRPSAFSVLKASCWLLLLLLEGINPLAVGLRHCQSLKKKQQEFWRWDLAADSACFVILPERTELLEKGEHVPNQADCT